MQPCDILLLSTADWDNPSWTNKQHVAAELARRGFRILYVELPGTRRPTVTRRDLGRIWRRLGRGLTPPRRVRDNVWVWSPIVIPWQHIWIIRQLNRLLLSVQLLHAQHEAGFSPRVMWTYWPLTTLYYDTARYGLVVYHSVDDIKEQPGMPKALIAVAEQDMARAADVIFTTSPHLYEVNKALNPNTHFQPNVADFGHFNRAMQPGPLPADLEPIAEPRIGFIGAVSGYKQDFQLIAQTAEARPDYQFVLIGDVGEGDPLTDPGVLRARANIHLMGPRAYADLPDYLRGFQVAILPSRLNEYTRSMFPMKFFEYLAAGRPVVGTRIESLLDYEGMALLREPEAFARGLDEALAGQLAPLDERLDLARNNTYETRTDRMLALIDALKAG